MGVAKKDIHKTINKNEGVLQTDDGVAFAEILDEELDPFRCYFDAEGNVEIDTSAYTSISLSVRNLKQLNKLGKEAKKYYEEYYENEDDD